MTAEPGLTHTATRGKLLTPEEVAGRLGVSPGWVRDHSTRKHPRLPAVRIGRFLRYRHEDLERWIDEQGQGHWAGERTGVLPC